MGFQDSYKTYSGIQQEPDKRCILSFFGYGYKKEKESYTKKYVVTDYDDPFRRTKSVYESDKREYWEFVRRRAITPKTRELEDRFVSIARKNDRFRCDNLAIMDIDPFKMPYIPVTLSEYYDRAYRNKPMFRGFYIPLFAVPPTILYAILLEVVLSPYLCDIPVIPDLTLDAFLLLAIPVTFALIGLGVALLQKAIAERKRLRMPWFDILPEEEKEEVQCSYFVYMEKKYGKEAGAVLQEYAKETGKLLK